MSPAPDRFPNATFSHVALTSPTSTDIVDVSSRVLHAKGKKPRHVVTFVDRTTSLAADVPLTDENFSRRPSVRPSVRPSGRRETGCQTRRLWSTLLAALYKYYMLIDRGDTRRAKSFAALPAARRIIWTTWIPRRVKPPAFARIMRMPASDPSTRTGHLMRPVFYLAKSSRINRDKSTG